MLYQIQQEDLTFFSGVWCYNIITANLHQAEREMNKTMTVYVDILFFINFFMNYMVASICGALLPVPLKNRRKLLASVLGGVYGVCVFIPDLTFIYSLFPVFLFSAGAVAILFCPCRVKDYIRYLGVYFITSFMLAGGIYVILPYMGGGVVRNTVIYYQSLPLLAVSGGVCCLCLKVISYIRQGAKRRGYNVRIKYRENSVELTGILDTGNMLCHPITGMPVLVGDEEILKRLFSKDCSIFNLSEWIDSTHLKLIPYKTLDGKGVMTGFLAEEIYIDGKKTKAIVAISPVEITEGILINSAVL